MIAPLNQPLHIDLPRQAMLETAAQVHARWAGVWTMALGFFCFLPYPALPIGGATAIQLGNVLTLAMSIPVLAMSWQRRPFHIYLLILAPLFFSLLKVCVSDGGSMAMSFKGAGVWGLSCLTIIATQLYAPRHAAQLLTGIAAATLVHVAVGAWQMYGFATGDLPLFDLYVNPSFLSVQANAEIIARYIQRPFGLFPEPSAMSSSLAPWILLWTAELFGIVKLKHPPAKWQRALFATAAAAGLALTILSQSGHAMFTVAGMVLFAAIWFVRARVTTRTFLAIAGTFGVIVPVVVWFAMLTLTDRFEGKSDVGNSSWDERSTSLRIGFSLLADGGPATVFFGMGVGLSAPALWDAAKIVAVFSVLLTYIYETGLVGLLAIAWIGQHIVRLWHSIRYDLTFAVIAGVWLVGITLTTSYEQLLPIWMALGWLTVWNEICETAPRPVRAPVRRSFADDVSTLPNRWSRGRML